MKTNKYMENSKTNTGIGGLCTIVFIVFLILKLAGVGSVATWSWRWVTSPLWLPIVGFIGFIVLMAFLAFVGFVIAGLFKVLKTKKI